MQRKALTLAVAAALAGVAGSASAAYTYTAANTAVVNISGSSATNGQLKTWAQNVLCDSHQPDHPELRQQQLRRGLHAQARQGHPVRRQDPDRRGQEQRRRFRPGHHAPDRPVHQAHGRRVLRAPGPSQRHSRHRRVRRRAGRPGGCRRRLRRHQQADLRAA